MKKNVITWSRVFTTLAFILLIAACAARGPGQNAVTIETKQGPRAFYVELAETPEQQEKGLMNRTSLPEDAGMLFVFSNVSQRVFWMKDTLVPLDMLFLGEDGTVHHIHHMAKPLDRTMITSQRPVKAVLEINGGLSGTLGIEEGDKVIHPVFRNQLDE